MSQNTPTPPAEDRGPAFEPGKKVTNVFSTMEKAKVGTGTTTRRVLQKKYWFVTQIEEDLFECQIINAQMVPTGPKKNITQAELLERFEPEPEMYYSSMLPSMQKLNNALNTGDKLRERGSNFASEHAYNEALSIDEENIRANFGIGIIYCKQGVPEKAKNIFTRLVNLPGTFAPQHKHLFNEFGINLRKQGMLKESAEYYNKALELSPRDENLHINVARTFCELENYPQGLKHILAALIINPRHEAARKFYLWMQQKNLIPEDMKKNTQAVLSRVRAAMQQSIQQSTRLDNADPALPQEPAASDGK